jgi:glycosyltransferase involved in cell wall biosynthesis
MYSELFDTPHQMVRFIPNSRPVMALARKVNVARSNRRGLRQERGLPVEGFIVLCIARLDVQKGQDLLIRAAAQARASHKELHLCLAGDGPLRKLYEELAASHLGDACTFLGNREDVTELLACADAFVLPSRYEGLSGALIEAMAAGVPIVASDISANRELISNDQTGLLFDSESPEALAVAILEVVANPGTAATRAVAASELAASSYDEGIERAGWIRLMAELAK